MMCKSVVMLCLSGCDMLWSVGCVGGVCGAGAGGVIASCMGRCSQGGGGARS